MTELKTKAVIRDAHIINCDNSPYHNGVVGWIVTDQADDAPKPVDIMTTGITSYDTVGCGENECNVTTKSGSYYRVIECDGDFWKGIERVFGDKVK